MGKDAADKNQDVVLISGPTEDGQGVRAIRARKGKVGLAELRPLKEGQPINAQQIVRLKKRQESPLAWDVEVQHDLRDPDQTSAGADGDCAGHAGPARVANAAFRTNYHAIFANKKASASGDSDLN